MPIGATITMNNASGVAQSTADLVQSLVQAALNTWGQMLAGYTTINVRISIVDTTSSGRAQGGNETGIFAVTRNGYNVFEPGTAYELRTGLQHDQTGPDIHIQIARDYLLNELFLDTTLATSNDIPSGRTDGYSVFLHELGHGLGFIGYYNEAADTFYSNANTPYDTRLIRNGGGDVRFDGPNVRAVYGNSVPLTDMNYSHYGNTNAFPGTSSDPLTGLMNGVVYYRGYRYGISSLDLAFMADMGIGTVANDVFDLNYFHAFTGGLGNDTYHVYAQSDVVREFANEGTDTVIAHSNYYLGSNIENLMLAAGAGNIFGVGNELANNMTGNEANNMLDGGGGADTLIGGAGDDIYTVDNAGDVIVEAVGDGNDTIKASVSYVLGAAVDVETTRLIGTANLNLTGNADHQILIGNAGNNTIDGGGGGDRMKGAAGDDTYIVRSAADTIVEVTGDGDDTVKAAVSYTLSAAAQVEHLYTLDASATTAIDLTGNDYSHDIQGNAGVNVLTGGSGNDTLSGNGGADTLIGGAGDDIYSVSDAATVIVESVGNGNDTIKASVSYVLGAGVDVETIRLIGTANLNLTGNADHQILIGNAGSNIIDGGGGGDRMKGAGGDDTYIVRSAADTIVEITGDGNDTARTAVSYTLGAAAQIEHLFTIDALATTAINLTGNDFSHDLQGNAGANVLTAGSGDDVLQGFAGIDTLFGGGGADRFVFDHGAGQDTVGDFVSGSDKLDLSALGFASFAAVQAATHDVGGSAVIDLGSGDCVTLSGCLTAQLQSGDVILTAGGAQAPMKIGIVSGRGWAVVGETGYSPNDIAVAHHFTDYLGPGGLPACQYAVI